jgi:hypothetical protein
MYQSSNRFLNNNRTNEIGSEGLENNDREKIGGRKFGDKCRR